MKVRIPPAVRRDLLAIGGFVARDNPRAGMKLADELEAACHGLASFPDRFPAVGSRSGQVVRKRTVGSYLILYEVGQAEVRIVRVIHSARKWRDAIGLDD